MSSLTSILSYKDRGNFGKSSYRGNCSGNIIKDLLEHFKPKRFLEVFAGSGTGFEVAKSLGYNNSIHLDLNPKWGSWNALTDELPTGSDFVFSHPPYWNIIQYSGKEWGNQVHNDDLSQCSSFDEFITKLNLINAKIYNSLLKGGRHATLIGDVRKNGKYYSILKEMMFIGDLESHIIKVQHNCYSDRIKYSNNNFIPILHEHLLVFKKNLVWHVPLTIAKKINYDLRYSDTITWRDLIQSALDCLGGKATLSEIYHIVQDTKKAKLNKHWKEKIRQTLQIYKDFSSVDRGTWKLSLC